jgi:predicted RecA/RadA family phage recombinase
MGMIFAQIEPGVYERLANTTGANLNNGDFCILGDRAAVAQEDILAGARGGFLSAENAVLKINTEVMVEGENLFTSDNAKVYFDNVNKLFSDTKNIGYFEVGQVNTKLENSVILFDMYSKVKEITLDTGIPFTKTVTLSAAAAETPIDIITDGETNGKSVHVTSGMFTVSGSTAWTDTTATVVTVQDTADTPVTGVTIAKAALTANAVLVLTSANVTLGAAVSQNSGFTAGKGLTIKGDANFAAGSDLVVTITGYLA